MTRALGIPHPRATAQRIRDGESLFRLSIVGHVVTITLFAIVSLALYRLLGQVNATHAVPMVTLAIRGPAALRRGGDRAAGWP